MLILPNKSNSCPVVILSTQELLSQIEICSFIYVHSYFSCFPQSLFVSFCWNFAQWYKSRNRKRWWKWIFLKILLFLKNAKSAQNGTKVELPWAFKKVLLLVARSNLKWKTLQFCFSVKNHIWENSSQAIGQNILAYNVNLTERSLCFLSFLYIYFIKPKLVLKLNSK